MGFFYIVFINTILTKSNTKKQIRNQEEKMKGLLAQEKMIESILRINCLASSLEESKYTTL